MTPVLLAAPDRLRTSLAHLRGLRTAGNPALSPLPIRVAECADGSYEVFDGFKRLAQWREEGRKEVPIVVEPLCGVALKASILLANAPARTSSPMDEARVVRSLLEDDKLTPRAIGKLLGRKPSWVSRRLQLAGKLASELAERLDAGKLPVSVASALCGFDKGNQVRLAEALRRHALSSREALAFFETYRAAQDAPSREALLRDPRSGEPRAGDQGASPLGPTAQEAEAWLERLQADLRAFGSCEFSGFSEPERRVLEARRRAVVAECVKLAPEAKEVLHGSSRQDPHRGTAGPGDVDPGHRPQAGPRCQNDPPGTPAAGGAPQTAEARSVQAEGPGSRRRGLHGNADPAGAEGQGVRWLPEHPRGVPAARARAP